MGFVRIFSFVNKSIADLGLNLKDSNKANKDVMNASKLVFS